MNLLKEAQLALVAYADENHDVNDLLARIEKALSGPRQEPGIEVMKSKLGGRYYMHPINGYKLSVGDKLYTPPPAPVQEEPATAQEPVGEVVSTNEFQAIIGWYGEPQPPKAKLYTAPQTAPVQEPVAFGVFGRNLHDTFCTAEEAQEMARLKGDGSTVKPLYTAPQPAQQEPWGFHIQFNNGKDATFKGLDKLAECEAHQEAGETITLLYTAPPAQQQEPTCNQDLQVWVQRTGQFSWEPQDERFWTRLTTPPAQRTWVGLTAEDRVELWKKNSSIDSFVNATEAKLKEKNT